MQRLLEYLDSFQKSRTREALGGLAPRSKLRETGCSITSGATGQRERMPAWVVVAVSARRLGDIDF